MITSLKGKKWVIKNQQTTLAWPDYLLDSRGLTSAEIALPEPLDLTTHLPSPERLPDLFPAIQRLHAAVAAQEKIMIFGDYDADGVTATAVLFRALKALGAVVSYRLPHRAQDGYGLKDYFVREMAELGVTLLITVDNGIAAHTEIALASQLGIDVIVTDHHQPPATLPTAAVALINPHRRDGDYPYPHLSGSVVAWKLVQALLGEDNPLTQQLMAWALIGLIADCMPLQQENRRFVQIALPYLRRLPHRGLRALGDKLSLKWETLSTDDIAFYLAPCLNAAGRLDSPLLALHLFLQEDKATALADHLYRLNRQRQDLTEQYYAEAEEILAPAYQPDDPIIMVGSDRWHPGVIGLIAGRLASKYARPAVVMSKMNDLIVGSARSFPWFDLAAALAEHAPLFSKFGGHVEAAGFALPENNLPHLIPALRETARRWLDGRVFTPELEIDTLVHPAELTMTMVDYLERLAPFGVGNAEPVFLSEQLTVIDQQTVGRDQQHLRLVVEKDGGHWPIIAFSFGGHAAALRRGQVIDAVYQIKREEWNGQPRLQWRLLDARIPLSQPSESV